MRSATEEKIGVGLIVFTSAASIIVPVAVDWNSSHLFNENWPSHAKLHDAMSFLMSMGLGAGALWVLFTRKGRRESDLALAAFLSVWGWIALLLGKLAPGATYENPAEGLDVPVVAHVPILPNAALSVILVLMGIAGWWLLRSARRKTVRDGGA